MPAPDTRLRLLGLWVPVVAWAAIIFAASSVSHPPELPPRVTDKMVHAAVYGIFALTWIRALAGSRRSGVTVSVVAWAILAVTLYGVTDEVHQSFVPGRTPDARDVAADFAGAATIAAGAWGYERLRPRRPR